MTQRRPTPLGLALLIILGTGCGPVADAGDVFVGAEQRANAYALGCIAGFSSTVERFPDRQMKVDLSMTSTSEEVSPLPQFEYCDVAIEAAVGSTAEVDVAAIAYGEAKRALMESLAPTSQREIDEHPTDLADQIARFAEADRDLREALGFPSATDWDAAFVQAASSDADLDTLVVGSRLAAEFAFGVLLDGERRLVLAVEHDRIDGIALSERLSSLHAIWTALRARAPAVGTLEPADRWTAFIAAGDRFVETMTNLERRVRQTQPFTAEELDLLSGPSTAVVGSPQNILGAYRAFVEAGTRLGL